jgi:hypothetical protein
VIKQGDKIAHQKGWTRPKRERPKVPAKAPGRGKRAVGPKRSIAASQPSLFPDF